MKLLKRKSRDPSILERELELEREYRVANGREIWIRLCDTRVRYAFERTRKDLSEVGSINSSYFQMVIGPFIKLFWIPVGFVINSAEAFGIPSRCPKDPQTGKYILRYEE